MKNQLIFGASVISAFVVGHILGQKIQNMIVTERIEKGFAVFSNTFSDIITRVREEDISDEEIEAMINECVDFLNIVNL